MSGLQKEAIQMINGLSDDNLRYLIDFMKRFMLPKNMSTAADFDPEEECREAMNEEYGNIG